MTADEVLRLPLDEALIILRGQKVLKVGKFDYTLHPESGKLKESRASDHVPAWRRLPEREEPDFSRLMTPKQKTKAPRKKTAPETPASESPYPKTLDNPPTAPSQNRDCEIVMTDKKSIMS